MNNLLAKRVLFAFAKAAGEDYLFRLINPWHGSLRAAMRRRRSCCCARRMPLPRQSSSGFSQHRSAFGLVMPRIVLGALYNEVMTEAPIEK
jgi:hypothetical protein